MFVYIFPHASSKLMHKIFKQTGFWQSLLRIFDENKSLFKPPRDIHSFCIAIDLLHDVNHLKIGWEFYWQRHQFQSMYLAARFLKVSIFLLGCSISDEDINSIHTTSISSLYGAEECFSDMQSPINIPRTGDKLTFVSNIR